MIMDIGLVLVTTEVGASKLKPKGKERASPTKNHILRRGNAVTNSLRQGGAGSV